MENRRICIIEDNTPNRKLFAMLLKKSGYEVFDFPDAQTSLEWLSSNKVDFILMDILLPDMNGTELIQHIRNISGYEKTIIIAITGFTAINDKDKFLNVGFNGYISKPINTNTFIKDIELIFTTV